MVELIFAIFNTSHIINPYKWHDRELRLFARVLMTQQGFDIP